MSPCLSKPRGTAPTHHCPLVENQKTEHRDHIGHRLWVPCGPPPWGGRRPCGYDRPSLVTAMAHPGSGGLGFAWFSPTLDPRLLSHNGITSLTTDENAPAWAHMGHPTCPQSPPGGRASGLTLLRVKGREKTQGARTHTAGEWGPLTPQAGPHRQDSGPATKWGSRGRQLTASR